MKHPRTIFAALLGACLTSCASPGPIGMAPTIEVADLSELPRPETDEAAVVRQQDQLRINVLGFPDLSREFQVGASGTFQFPLIGLVEASGRTPYTIAQEIEARLDGIYVVNPEVIVDAIEQPGRLFTVGGQVSKPGRYPVIGSTSLLEAVAVGGGISEFADLEEVLIFRTIDGQRYIGAYNLEAIQRGNYADPTIYADDVIMVGDSPARRQLATILSLSPLLTLPVILLDRLAR